MSDVAPVVRGDEGQRRGGRPSAGRSAAPALAVAAGTWALYWVGSTRPFSYDAAVSVKHFIATPSLLDPFRRHVVFNNHPLLSFLDHLVFTMTGRRGEMALRALPVTFAAVTAGLLVWLLSPPFGRRAALCGAAVLVANPVFLGNARDVRGYSLLTLCAVGSTAVLMAEPFRRRRPVYGLVAAVGAATHAYMVPVIVCHAALTWRRGERLKDWAPTWAVVVVVAILVELPALGSVGARGHRFRPLFPVELGFDLAGANTIAAVLTLVVAAVAVAEFRRRPLVRTAAAAAAAVVGGLWLWAPDDLYVRMFVWLVPGLAVLAAAVVARHRRLAPVVVAAAVAALVPQLADLRTPEIANRGVAHYLPAARDREDRVCALGFSVQGLGPYRLRFHEVADPSDLPRCDIGFVLLPGRLETPVLARAAATFPWSCELPAATPALVFSRRPLPEQPLRARGAETTCRARRAGPRSAR